MESTIRNLAIDFQDYVSQNNLSYGEITVYSEAIAQLAEIADETGGLYRELKENGII